MKPTEFLREFDEKDSGEYNDEAGMAQSNLETIVRSAQELEKHIGQEENLPEWCQEKLAVVKGMLTAVTDYMVSQDSLDDKQDDFAFDTDRIAEQLNSMLEGGPYDLPGIDYDRPGDVPRKPRAHGGTIPRRHNDDPDFMDPDQRRLRADQERLKKAWAEKNKGVAEGSDELYQKAIRKYAQRVANDYLGGGNEYLYGANKFDSEMFGVDPKQAQQDFETWFAQYKKGTMGLDASLEQHADDKMKELGHKFKPVAEGHADQQRKIFKKNGKPVGEVGIDRESSPGNGQWYMTCYGVVSYGGYDSYEEAVEELKHCLKQGVAEAYGPYGQKSPQDLEKIKKAKEREAKRSAAGQLRKSQSKSPYDREAALSYFSKFNEQDIAEGNDYDAQVNALLNEFAGGMGAGSVATAPGVGKGPKIGSLFGGSYAPKTPFNKKRKK